VRIAACVSLLIIRKLQTPLAGNRQRVQQLAARFKR
jgi:hypothetical protein